MAEPTSAVAAKRKAEEEVIGLSAEEEDQLVPEMTEEGRYIPYNGGSLGWYENSGVLKSEIPNNYLFHTVMASDTVRSKQFQRWGERFNRRGDRKRVRRVTGVTLKVGDRSWRGATQDISRFGVRLQLLDDVTVAKADVGRIAFHQSEDSETVLLECDVRVVWAQRTGKTRAVWNLGMTLENVTAEQKESLAPLLREY